MPAYETRIRVRFGDIDHAGIVYYPRISNYFHVAFEDFFADVVGIPYDEVLNRRSLGFPTVRSEIDYRVSLAFGDVAKVEIVVVHLGRSSLTKRYRLRKQGDEKVCVEGRITTVCVDMATFRPTPIPDDLRAVFAAHREE